MISTEELSGGSRLRFGPMLNKVPEITVYFWIIKILCTTVGETFADYLNTNLGFGRNNTMYLMGSLLAAALLIQFATRRYVAPVYWVAVVLISIFGTLITDKLTDDLGVALQITTAVFAVALVVVFLVWYQVERTLSMHSIFTFRREAFYWLAILFTFALGTAAGDLVAEQFNMGYLNSVLLFAGIIAAIGIAQFGLRVDAVVAFWAAYVMTRPLGASIGDYLAQDTVDGGLALGTTVTSLIFLTAILVLVVYLMVTKSDETGHERAGGARQIKALEAAGRFGWAGIAATVALTVGAMALASATGLAKTPSAATLAESEDAGGAAAADSAPPPAAGSPSTTVDVKLSEWSITTSVTSAKAGAVTFNITNAGPANTHEFIILKTDIAPDALPTARDKSLNESGAGITSPGEGGVLAVGKKQTITLTMTPGKYIFVDNVVEKNLVHWEKKAYAAFTVEPRASAGASVGSGSTSIVSLTSPVSLGQSASVKVKTAPGAPCSIVYTHPSGKASVASGLQPATADAGGSVSWTWQISPATKPLGNGTLAVTCDGEEVDGTFTIE